MDNEYWLARWQSNEIAFNQQQPNPYLVKYYNALNLKPGARIFVPLCGKSIDMLWLANQGCNVVGVELSLEACQQFFDENQLEYEQMQQDSFHMLTSTNITLISGDFFKINKTLIDNIDAIYDRAALVALPLETRAKYAKHVVELSGKLSQMLLITASYDQNEMQGPPFSVDEQEIEMLYNQHFSITPLLSEPAKEIAPHLQAKGLTKAHQLVFQLSRRG